MLILDSKPDYYDYISNIYGVDNKIVYDRHDSFILHPVEKTTYTIHVCGLKYVGVFYEGKMNWDLDTIFDIYFNDVLDRRRDTTLENYLYPGQWQWIPKKYNLRKQAAIQKIGLPSDVNKKLECPIVYSSGFKNMDHTKNIILSNLSFASIIPAETLYSEITMFLSYKEPVVETPPTDMIRFESKGFDKKTSFRNKK